MIAALTLLLLIAQAPQPTSSDGWTAAGWRALRAGAAEEASADFAQALRLNGANPLALLGAGSAANVRGRTDDARLYLTRALREQPSLTAASRLLGEILHRAADLNGYPKDILTVVLYSKEQFRDVTQSPSWAGGLYDGRIRVPVAGRVDEKALRRVLAHEFTHAVVYSLAPRGVPQWLNEGLAILMERGGEAPPPAPAEGDVASLAKLEGSFARLSPEEARTAYATSGAAAQALLDRGGPIVIYNLLANLGNGMTFEDAFERAALMPYSAFKDTWR